MDYKLILLCVVCFTVVAEGGVLKQSKGLRRSWNLPEKAVNNAGRQKVQWKQPLARRSFEPATDYESVCKQCFNYCLVSGKMNTCYGYRSDNDFVSAACQYCLYVGSVSVTYVEGESNPVVYTQTQELSEPIPEVNLICASVALAHHDSFTTENDPYSDEWTNEVMQKCLKLGAAFNITVLCHFGCTEPQCYEENEDAELMKYDVCPHAFGLWYLSMSEKLEAMEDVPLGYLNCIQNEMRDNADVPASACDNGNDENDGNDEEARLLHDLENLLEHKNVHK